MIKELRQSIKEKREKISNLKKEIVKEIKRDIKAFYDQLKVNTPQLGIDWSTDSEYNDEGGYYTTYHFSVGIDENNHFGCNWGDWEVYDCDGDEDDEDYFGKEPFLSIADLIEILRDNEELLGLDSYSDLDRFLENI